MRQNKHNSEFVNAKLLTVDTLGPKRTTQKNKRKQHKCHDNAQTIHAIEGTIQTIHSTSDGTRGKENTHTRTNMNVPHTAPIAAMAWRAQTSNTHGMDHLWIIQKQKHQTVRNTMMFNREQILRT